MNYKITTKIEIPISEYRRLMHDSDFLKALYEAGVDNWEGYSQACEEFDGDEDVS